MDWPAVDTLIVHGEVDPDVLGARRYPSFREVAERFGVSQTRIWQYSTKHRCLDRRKESNLRTLARTDQLLIESASLTTVELVQIVDQFILGFKKALFDGQVKMDSPVDFERLTRLRELLVGGADSRTELTGHLTLEAIQQRHRQLREQVSSATPELSGTATPHTAVEDGAAAPDADEDGGGSNELAGDAAAASAADEDGGGPSELAGDPAAAMGLTVAPTAHTRLETSAATGDRDPRAFEAAASAAMAQGAPEDDLPPWLDGGNDGGADDLEPEFADNDLVAERAGFVPELAEEEAQ